MEIVMKGFEVFYEFGPHQCGKVFVVAPDWNAARVLTKNMILEDYGEEFWERVGYDNMTVQECNHIPANNEFIY